MAYRVQLQPAADRQLDRLPRPVQVRVLRALHALADDPRPPGCKKLAGTDDLWRVRIGDYRVVYAIEDKRLIVLVVRVAHRKDVYRGD